MKFGDIAENIAIRVKPSESYSDNYVGLEHLDPESLHLKKWGQPSDVKGDKLRFWKGDIIFGRRRAYQRKLAIADFDGICSAHAMVLRAKPKAILPEFLPFFLQSDMFMERAIGISVGSLSPTINWRTLREEEFPLPPLDEQKRIAEILWAADEAVERYRAVKAQNEELYLFQSESLLFDERNVLTKVESVASVNRESLLESKTPQDFEFRYIDIGSVTSPKVIGDLNTYLFSDAPSRARRCVKEGDILIATVRPNLQSFVRLTKLNRPHIASTGFAVITPQSEVMGSLLFHAFFSRRFATYCEARITGTSYPAISADDIATFKVSIPNDWDKQIVIQEILDKLDDATRLIEDNTLKLFQMYRILVNQLITTGEAHV